MRLLIVTQKMDMDDPILGFFHNWVIHMSAKFEKVTVICLQKGKYELPSNVRVLSLGKEVGRGKFGYIIGFLNMILGLYKEYDSVFVHMNEEYVLLGGLIWKLLRKRVYMWRNHPDGSIFTRIAVLLCNKVFCTSEYSFTARFRKTIIMPVGIDTDQFKNIKEQAERTKNSVLMLGRISPIKRPDLLVEALKIAQDQNTEFVCGLYGDALPKDQEYLDSLKKRVVESGLVDKVSFNGSVPNYKTPEIYNQYQIFVNLTPSGSFDKTMLEAAACGCILLASNESLSGKIDQRCLLDADPSPSEIQERLSFLLALSVDDKGEVVNNLNNFVLRGHSLRALIEQLSKAIM